MPTYRNDSTTKSYRLNDINDIVQDVRPGESIQTYDPDVPDDFTETSESPAISKDISGENVWTDAIKPKGGLNFSISGEFVGTVTIQRSWDDFTTPKPYSTHTSSEEGSIADDADPNVTYRIGIGPGGFTSGVINVRLSRRFG